jgi:DNA helicase-2/ATP-dependent DNA helicase PcrA
MTTQLLPVHPVRAPEPMRSGAGTPGPGQHQSGQHQSGQHQQVGQWAPDDVDPATGIPLVLLDGLNPEQRAAVSVLSGPLLIVAGPGSGKTRVLTHRIAALLATGTRAGEILAVTFTNKAATEMRTRVAGLIGAETAQRMWIATFHSACVRILRVHHALVGLPRSFTIIDAADAAKLVGKALAELGETTGMNPTDTKVLIRDCYAAISRAKNAAQSAEALTSSANPDRARAGQVMVVYNRMLRERGAVDFDDILLATLHLLRDNPDVAASYQRRFAHVLVDEFQDTNAVQLDITQRLAGRGNLCVVGDADQSIYAFRGANPTVIGAFTQLYPDGTVVALGQNYRSTGAIVEVAQAVITPNPAAHRAVLRTTNPSGTPVTLTEAPNNWDEARKVIEAIRTHGGPLSEHAVLVRTNALTSALETVLREAALPYDLVGATRFFDRAEIKDVLAYLRLAVNPADTFAFERCVNQPKRGVGEATVEALTADAAARGVTPLAAAQAVVAARTRGADKLAGFLTVHTAVAAAALAGPVAAVTEVLDPVGLRAVYRAVDLKEQKEDTREGYLLELVDLAREFAAGRIGVLPDGVDVSSLPGVEQVEAFLEYAALMSAAESPGPAAGSGAGDLGRVQVATMHSAKGREWDHVYVVGLEDNICPHVRALNSGLAAELEEERRLLFVAVSRARKTLDLSYCRSRRMFNRDTANPPSRFLDDLPATVVRRTGNFVSPSARVSPPWAQAAARTGVRSPGTYPSSGAQPWTPATRTATPASAAPRTGPKPAGPRLPDRARVGDRVGHGSFGDGVITAVDGDRVTVTFAESSKTLLRAVAPLVLL